MQKLFTLFSVFCFVAGLSLVAHAQSCIVEIGPFSQGETEYHQQWIQEKMDGTEGIAPTFVFAPGEYVISNPNGLLVPEGATLIMEGARFSLAEKMTADGQCFLLDHVSNVSFRGGEIIGSRDTWDRGTNIGGIRVLGDVESVKIADMTFKNLSSNAVGVFGESDEKPIRDVTLKNVVAVNCCNYYGDYLQPDSGPAKGSDRKDQGTVAFYHVLGWLVDGCRFEGSQSDGTHFYHSHNGIFVNNVVMDSKMGGYFIEGCEQVIVSENLIMRNGSRGCTIERNSRYCTLTDNVVCFSGREGLWAPDVLAVVVSSNIFRENGQKDDKERDCEIRLDNTDHFETNTRDIQITDNMFYTKEHQTAAIYIGQDIKDIRLENNMHRGPAKVIHNASKE